VFFYSGGGFQLRNPVNCQNKKSRCRSGNYQAMIKPGNVEFQSRKSTVARRRHFGKGRGFSGMPPTARVVETNGDTFAALMEYVDRNVKL